MEYAWLEPRHDPIATDTNLAEIDFEDFKNEDLAFAFSCGEEESGGSSTDMSICRSEVLFSSMRDSVDPHLIAGAGGALQDSLCQDSLLVDGDFNYSEQVKVNKNNYTLTFSGHGAMGSFIQSMVSSGAIGQVIDENNGGEPPLPSGLDSPGKLITWYNLGKQQQQPERICRSRFREENTLNNNTNGEDSRKSRSLPDIGRERDARSLSGNRFIDDGGGGDVTPAQVPATVSEVKLVNAFFRGRRTPEQEDGASPTQNDPNMIRSKDTVNHFLKAASRLTSIEEAAVEGYSSASSGSSGSGRQAGRSSSSDSPTLKLGRQTSARYPDIDFLENDVSLWDAFFLRGKTSGRFQSVLMRPPAPTPAPPPLPVEEYLRYQPQSARRVPIMDADSLRLLLPQAHRHLVPNAANPSTTATATTTTTTTTPITQVCQSLSKIHMRTPPRRSEERPNEEAQSTPSSGGEGGAKQKWSPGGIVREAWTVPSETPTSPGQPIVVRRRRPSRRSCSANSTERNLNALNNNGDENVDVEDVDDDFSAKRRSYHPQDYLSKILTRSSHSGRKSDFPKSGSQNDLCDSWAEEEESEDSKSSTPLGGTCSGGSRGRGTFKNLSAEYPFQRNMCMPHQGINFDLTHKRGLFVSLYSAVERLLMYQDGDTGGGGSARYVLLQELCPALHAIMEDGLKPEVITSFGRMQTSVWRVVEAVTRQGGPNAGTTVCDLVMLLNTKFAAIGEDHRKFAGFVVGLINMSTLHVWYTKLKWSMDVLLRFYERHAFICALHKETKLLFDELIYCLQRLYSINCRIDLPFNSDLLEDIPLLVTSPKLHYPGGCVCGSGGSSSNSSRATSTTTSVATNTTAGSGGRKGSLTSGGVKSRIPRPISLPKRLEAKLGTSPSPVRSSRGSRPPSAIELGSPTKPPLMPTTTSRKSRVRDTIKLFDSKAVTTAGGGSSVADAGVVTGFPPTPGSRPKGSSSGSRKGKTGVMQLKSPKTGAGESMALDSSGEHMIIK